MSDFYFKYFTVVILAILLCYMLLFSEIFGRKYNRKLSKIIYLCFVILILFMFGLRDGNIGVDTSHYLLDFNIVSRFESFSQALKFSTIARDPFFVSITFLCSKIMSGQFYLFFLSFIYIWLVHRVINRLTLHYHLLYFISFLCFSFFYSMGINVIRSGISGMLSLLGIITLFNIGERRSSKVYVGFIYLFIGFLFHSSAILFFIVFIFVKFVKLRINIFYWTFFIVFFLASRGYGIKNIPILGVFIENNDRISVYASDTAVQEASGFNIFGIFFQILGIFYGYYFMRKRNNFEYLILNKIYLALSVFYFLCLDLAFSDRFGVLSWILLPLILAYPLFENSRLVISKDLIIFSITSFTYLLLNFYRTNV